MRVLKNCLSVIASDIFLILRKIFGCKVLFKRISIVSPYALIKTKGKKSVLKIGYRSAIRSNTEISVTDGIIDIGDKCFINRNCMIVAHEKIIIGNNTTIGPNCCIYDHDHNFRKEVDGEFTTGAVIIGNNVWIGAGVIILKGSLIGDNCVIGAGAIIKGIIAENTIVIPDRDNIIKRYT